ncbi:MAG: hypothetical protein CME66_06350 [Halobacteriovoraceae bacterium]|jgi:hypothetical protein|nr:hypothetical protein [Halobacteriovoraceae bacterium]
MIQDPSKELTLIVYNTPKPPRYLRVKKRLIKTMITVIPLLVISSILLSFLYSMYLKNQLNQLKSREPLLINQLKSEKEELANSLSKLKKNNLILTQKLSKGSTAETSNSALALFTTPLGLEDLRSKELIKIENLKLNTNGQRIKLNFDLANNSPDNSKLSGFISVLQFQDNTIQYYPSYELSQKNLRMEYSQGESFSFSRFRPTTATFKKLIKSSAKYKIFIFSRTGNLLVYKQIGPYNIE